MRSITSMGKKGQVLSAVQGTVMGIMVLIFLVFAVLFAIAKLNPSSFFTAGSSDANATANLQANLTSGVSQFSAYIPTVFIVLGVVLILAAIAILIVYVVRMRGAGGGGSL